MKSINEINNYIKENRDKHISVKDISDGHHTFGEYIDMRNQLFIALCNTYSDIAWKSRKHYDEKNDPMYNGDFIAGIDTPDGVVTFHLKMKYWSQLNVKELENAPKYDGYTEEIVKKRIRSLTRQ